jgi:hypothetical protein
MDVNEITISRVPLNLMTFWKKRRLGEISTRPCSFTCYVTLHVTCCLLWWTQQRTGALWFSNNFIRYVKRNICQDLLNSLTSVWQWKKCTSHTYLECFIYTPEATKQHCMFNSNRSPTRCNSFQFIILTFIYAARPRTQHDYHHDTKVKPEAATAVVELLMMGGRTSETCWAVNKRQDNKLKNCCVWLVIYLNCTMMHGLTNLKHCTCSVKIARVL